MGSFGLSIKLQFVCLILTPFGTVAAAALLDHLQRYWARH